VACSEESFAFGSNADSTILSMWLRELGEIEEGEHVIGTSMYTGEKYGGYQDPVTVFFYISKIERKYESFQMK
jgi:hypothetical protein